MKDEIYSVLFSSHGDYIGIHRDVAEIEARIWRVLNATNRLEKSKLCVRCSKQLRK